PMNYYEVELTFEPYLMKSHTLRGIVVPSEGVGQIESAIKTQQILSFCIPRSFLLVGLAGGIEKNDVALGDVLIATSIIDYERQRVGFDQTEIRWRTYELIQSPYFEFNALNDSWFDIMHPDHLKYRKPKVHLGPILSGEKIIASSKFVDRFLEVYPSVV